MTDVTITFNYRDDIRTLQKAIEVFSNNPIVGEAKYEVYGSYGRYEEAKELQAVVERVQSESGLNDIFRLGLTISFGAAQLWLDNIEEGTKGAGCSNFSAFEVGKTIEHTVLLAWLQKFVIAALVAEMK